MCFFGNIIFPLLTYFYFSLIVLPALAIFIVLSEVAVLFVGIGKQQFGRCVGAVLYANAASTFVGFIFTALIVPIHPGYEGFRIKWWIISYLVAFGFSMLIEFPINRAIIGKDRQRQILLGTVLGNLLSYLGCGVAMAYDYLHYVYRG